MIKYVTLEEHLENVEKQQVLSASRAEKSYKAEIGMKPRFHKGKSIKDWWTCGNCGKNVTLGVTQNYCFNCGYNILWSNPRCLTK